MNRVYIPPDDAPGEQAGPGLFELPEDAAHYVRNVLRMSQGDLVELFDGTGRVMSARLANIDRDRVVALLQEIEQSSRRESPINITLVQAIPKGKRWRWTLEKATELGVRRIIPIETEHTVVSISESKRQNKLDRWRRIAASATGQSGRSYVPDIEFQTTLEQAARQCEAPEQVVASTNHASNSIGRHLAETPPDEDVAIWIGPEGGFSDPEIDWLVQRGVVPVHLGPRICRTETAAVVALCIAQYVLGDLE